MTIRRTAAAMTAVAAMTALAACGGDDNGDANGDEDEDLDVEVGSEDDFITDLEFTTGGTGGTYYPLGGELAEIFSSETDASVNYVESGGSGENLGRIYNEQSQLGLTQNDTAAEAFTGELEDLDGIEIDNVGWIANLYPEAMHIVVREDSGIESIDDLDGATIAVGDVGSGTRIISDAILEYYETDFTPEVTDFGASTEMLADGQIDASMFVAGPPVAALTQLAATTDVTLLTLDEADAEEIAGDALYDPYSISADSYDFLDEDVTTLSVFAVLAASTTQVSEDLAYDITAALFDNAEQITLDVGENIDVEEALYGIGDLPLHPGAERYFEEQGIDRP
ncbi:TAXI family TRAP transporter solute-binding subunit [Nesterenkonia muleiensis]|uniref:TAXI family TRAP transporter solute-binding subunit n=1 Tax=Nesterenkonia muleiensis TaxID=2282648 RepID=UPI000E721545|nr:TAXI family TRAP transporter solute-binding subunit [Nesterenkonia muleiensis]